ncbi:LLM class flavin-dependent oxidoreductase [Advenella sp. WQ 585]|uniref:LLM class flavin-dependent oxidoreductase n=1 Tax=Advenella mandrilli TaxID=2800330 RepID=A0ABS1EEF3_9BURK|nr:LLM class flavin-dependent oxidoreductase [Advenella mandrilli]MBK1781124.1 LLM class flavin-dependent oxidoreductase [Advenella mandrilli]
MVPFSILDLSPVNESETVGDALANSLLLAKKAEACGFTRFWMAEHHNIPGIASSATAVAIGYIAAGTSRIRVGSGGVMLPNHSPLIIAEQFGTLASLYPNRIDLGLGRAPGTDMNTARALRRDLHASAENFPQDVQELQYYFRQPEEGQKIVAVPAAGVQVPVWLLGSSLYSAQLAAYLGLPFSFASHFAPGDLMNALSVYRSSFRPSVYLDKPYASACVNVVAAQTDELAKYHFTSHQMASVQLFRNTPGKLQPPVNNIDEHISPAERASINHKLIYSMVGSAKTVADGISDFVEMTGVDELMMTSRVYDVAARLESIKLVSSAF